MALRVTTPVSTGPADRAGALTERLARAFKLQIEDWCDVCQRSLLWEARYRTDPPPLELWTEHAQLLDELERVGRFLSQSPQNTGLADASTAERIAAMLQEVRDRRAIWHGRMKHRQREALLRELFPEA